MPELRAGPEAAAAFIGSLLSSQPKPKTGLLGGVTQRVSPYATVNEYDPNADITGPDWYGSPGVVGISQKMMRDPYCRASINYRCNPQRAALWEAAPGDRRPESVECADWLNWNLFELLRWDPILCNLMLFHRDGFVHMEAHEALIDYPMDRFPLHKGRGKGIVLRGLELLPAWTMHGWEPNPANPRQLAEIEQHITSSNGFSWDVHRLDVGRDLILRLTQEQEGSNFEGFPSLRSAYGSWTVKRKYLLIEAIKHERFGVGAFKGKVPEDASHDDEEEFEEFLADFAAGATHWITFPEGYDVDIIETRKGEGTNLTESIKERNFDIFVNVNAQFNLLGSSNFGSYALAQTISGQFGLAVEGDTKTLEGGINHGSDGWSVVDRIAKLNYPTAAPPVIRARNLPIHDYLEGLKVLATLAQNQIINPDQRIEDIAREQLKLSERLADSPVGKTIDKTKKTTAEEPFTEEPAR